MAREIREAQAKDRKEAASLTEASTSDLLTASGAQHDKGAFFVVCAKWINLLRTFFAGRALRRTLRTLDYEDKPLWLMPDPVEVQMKLNLHDHELDVLENAAETAKANTKKDSGWRAVRDMFFFKETEIDFICSLSISTRASVSYIPACVIRGFCDRLPPRSNSTTPSPPPRSMLSSRSSRIIRAESGSHLCAPRRPLHPPPSPTPSSL